MAKIEKYMRDAAMGKLIPYLASLGFTHHGSLDTDGKSPEIKRAFPFGSLKREVGQSFQIVELQFHKYDPNKLVLNFGIVPPEGVSMPWGHYSRDQVTAGSIPGSYRLFSNARFMRWFSVGWFVIDKKKGADKEIDRVIDLFAEAEVWFASGKVGSHMRQLGYAHSRP